MKDSEVVAQFRASESFLAESVNPLRKLVDCDRIRRYLAKKADAFQSIIGGLRVGMKHVNLRAKVLKISKSVSVSTRFGNSAVLANALIGDKNGTIKITLWELQIDSVSVDDVIQIRDASGVCF